jgi:sigma-B regulation protein RsbU (phosphoserine phosphatase)
VKSDHYIKSLKKRQGLLIIILAALMLEVLSGVQYYYTHRLMEQELEKRAEIDLTMKALLIKSTLNDAEDILNNHMWRIEENLDEPDSAYTTMKRMVKLGAHLHGGCVGFEPHYYPEKGRLFEVYARRNADGNVETTQIGGDDHDYTQLDFYQAALTDKDGLWVDPYVDKKGAQATVTSFLKPVHDSNNKVAGVVSVDLSLKWLTDTIDRRHIYPSSFIVLLTESGAPVIRPSEERVSKETADSIIRFINDSTVTRQKSTSGQTTVIHFDTDKRDGTIFYANMKGKPHWQIAVVCYDDEVYASLNLSRLWYLLLMVAAFGILLFVVWRFAHGVKKLEEKTMEEERLVGELRIANGIQQALRTTLLDQNYTLGKTSQRHQHTCKNNK